MIHKKIADAMPRMEGLSCLECGRQQRITTEGAAKYLRSGWPKCCGYTMRLHTENDPLPPKAPRHG